jgi:large subunit ribosomal protein L31
MKTSIHPKYFEATIACASCNTTFKAGSTIESARVDICSNCHPFYTGQKKLIDTEGRVERFERRLSQRKEQPKPQKAQPSLPSTTNHKAAPAKPSTTSQDSNRPKSLREMLQEAANNS